MIMRRKISSVLIKKRTFSPTNHVAEYLFSLWAARTNPPGAKLSYCHLQNNIKKSFLSTHVAILVQSANNTNNYLYISAISFV